MSEWSELRAQGIHSPPAHSLEELEWSKPRIIEP